MYKQGSAIKLVEFIRDGLIEQEHFGYIVKSNKNSCIEKYGSDNDYPFYLRSCAKPLQASLLIDYGLDKKYKLTPEEIALCCASHAGEDVHIKVLENMLSKFNLKKEMLKCGKHSPLSQAAQEQLLLKGEKPTELHNNCSGKHILMLALCKLNSWDTQTYDNLNHPLQKEIKRKIYKLCGLDKEYPITKDGCGVPIHSMPLGNIVLGYLNLFCNKKYEKIKQAFLDNPYLIGGENRTDTLIISQSENIIAKVGAGGLCVVVNTELEQGFVVKICDANMQSREIVVCDYLKKLGWASVEVSHDIKTLHKDKVGEIRFITY